MKDRHYIERIFFVKDFFINVFEGLIFFKSLWLSDDHESDSERLLAVVFIMASVLFFATNDLIFIEFNRKFSHWIMRWRKFLYNSRLVFFHGNLHKI